MFFKKDELEYTRGKKFFIYNDKVVNFDDIKEIDSKTTTETKNSVYIKRELVVKLYFQTGGLLLRVNTQKLERYKLLSELVEDIKKYKGIASAGIPYPLPSKKESKYWLYIKILFVLFGINGLSEIWFNTSLLRHVDFFAVISGISAILLSVMIVTTPIIFLANKLNMRKFQREDDFLAGRESRVKDIDFSNLLLVGLVGTLIIIMIWKNL